MHVQRLAHQVNVFSNIRKDHLFGRIQSNFRDAAYGLTGVITEMDVDLAQNQRLEPSFEHMPADTFGTRFIEALADDTVTMAYGRLSVDREDFMSDASMITFRPSADQSEIPAAQGSGAMAKLGSQVYRAQFGNERMKHVHWWFETGLGAKMGGGPVSRNSLINEPVVTLDDRNPDGPIF